MGRLSLLKLTLRDLPQQHIEFSIGLQRSPGADALQDPSYEDRCSGLVREPRESQQLVDAMIGIVWRHVYNSTHLIAPGRFVASGAPQSINVPRCAFVRTRSTHRAVGNVRWRTEGRRAPGHTIGK